MQLATRVASITPSSTLAITAKAAELKKQGFDVIGLGAGEPDFNTPQHIIQAAMIAAEEGHTKYTPSGGLVELKKAIVEKIKSDQNYSYDVSNVIVCNGAKHALYLLFQSILNPGDEVIIPAPYWVSYPEQVKLADGNPVILHTTEDHEFKITVEQLRDAVTSQTKAVIINSPSNPTGMLYTREELAAIGRFCLDNNILIISDEIYEKLVYHGAEVTSIAEISEEIRNNTVIINGVSKSHAMTGWRIGYAVGQANLIKAMTNVASHSTSNPTTISQFAAIAAYNESQEAVETMREAFEDRLTLAYDKLISIPGLTCLKPQGAFYLFPNASEAARMTGFSSVTEWVAAILDEAKVALVPGEGFGAPDNVRLSYATSQEQMNEALKRILQFMETHSK